MIERGFEEINSPIYKNYVIKAGCKLEITRLSKKRQEVIEYITKDKYFNQSITEGLSKEEKILENLRKSTKNIKTYITREIIKIFLK